MRYYFVAKTPRAGLLGQLTRDQIFDRTSRGEFADSYVVIESTGPSYSEFMKAGNGEWITIADFLKGMQPLATAESVSAPTQSASSTRPIGIVVGIIGILLLLFGALRWNSAESQFARVFGQTDSLSLVLFVVGVIALFSGLALALSSPPPRTEAPSPATRSVEMRLRQLDDLRSKGLISDGEYQQRKKEIIASL